LEERIFCGTGTTSDARFRAPSKDHKKGVGFKIELVAAPGMWANGIVAAARSQETNSGLGLGLGFENKRGLDRRPDPAVGA